MKETEGSKRFLRCSLFALCSVGTPKLHRASACSATRLPCPLLSRVAASTPKDDRAETTLSCEGHGSRRTIPLRSKDLSQELLYAARASCRLAAPARSKKRSDDGSSCLHLHLCLYLRAARNDERLLSLWAKKEKKTTEQFLGEPTFAKQGSPDALNGQ